MEPTPETLAPIGPGAAGPEIADPKALLDERQVGEYDYVEILNPLSVDFVGQAALTTNVQANPRVGTGLPEDDQRGLTRSENDMRSLYGFDLRVQSMAQGKTHTLNRITIPSGQTVRLLGSEAHVVLRQLVTAVLQREGKTALVASMHERRAVEERLVQHIGSLTDMMGRAPISIQDQLKQTLAQLDDNNLVGNAAQGVPDAEQAFPAVANAGTGADPGQGNEGDRATGQPGPRARGGKA